MVEDTSTTYIVSTKNRSEVELRLADADFRAAMRGDSSAQAQITRAYNAQSTYTPTDDLFASVDDSPLVSWSELRLIPVHAPTATFEKMGAQAASETGAATEDGGCDCSCSTCENTDYHCHNTTRNCGL